MKIKNYKNFLLEWGYGGEGGSASKDPIKVKTTMFTEIELDDDEEDEEDIDIPILSDINEKKFIKEQIDHSDVDPWGEEDWDDDSIELNYNKWEGTLYDFLIQLKNEDVDACIKNINNNGATLYSNDTVIDDLLSFLCEIGGLEGFDKIEKSLDVLRTVSNDDNDEKEDPRDNPDYWYDMNKDR